MSKKNWNCCGECKYLSQCPSGQTRIENVDPNSDIYSDIGCYNYEQYYLLTRDKQLKLF